MPFAVIEFLKPLFSKLLDWLPFVSAYLKGRSDGKAVVVAENTETALKIAATEEKAAAEAPKTLPGLTTILRDQTKEF